MNLKNILEPRDRHKINKQMKKRYFHLTKYTIHQKDVTGGPTDLCRSSYHQDRSAWDTWKRKVQRNNRGGTEMVLGLGLLTLANFRAMGMGRCWLIGLPAGSLVMSSWHGSQAVGAWLSSILGRGFT